MAIFTNVKSKKSPAQAEIEKGHSFGQKKREKGQRAKCEQDLIHVLSSVKSQAQSNVPTSQKSVFGFDFQYDYYVHFYDSIIFTFFSWMGMGMGMVVRKLIQSRPHL